MRGTIIRLVEDRGFGFIKPDEIGQNVFFHCSDLIGLEFSSQLLQLPVRYETRQTEKGLRAMGVERA